MTLRIGILGAARIAPAACIKPAQRTDGVEVVAIAARDESKARAFATKHNIDRVHASYRDLLDDPELERLHADRLATLKAEAERRAALGGVAVGCYARLTLRVPAELVEHWDPRRPLVVGALTPADDAGGGTGGSYLLLRLKRHR